MENLAMRFGQFRRSWTPAHEIRLRFERLHRQRVIFRIRRIARAYGMRVIIDCLDPPDFSSDLRIDSRGAIRRRRARRKSHQQNYQSSRMHANYFTTVMGSDTSTVFGG